MRPTKNISVGKFSSEKTDRISGVDVENSQLPTKDFLHWKTKSQWLHWDLNPWIWSSSNEGIKYKWEEDFIQENNGSGNDGEPKIQGLFNFVDNKVGDGGFCCVAGFNRVIKEYSAKTANSGYAKAHAKEYAFVEVHAGPIRFKNKSYQFRYGPGAALFGHPSYLTATILMTAKNSE